MSFPKGGGASSNKQPEVVPFFWREGDYLQTLFVLCCGSPRQVVAQQTLFTLLDMQYEIATRREEGGGMQPRIRLRIGREAGVGLC